MNLILLLETLASKPLTAVSNRETAYAQLQGEIAAAKEVLRFCHQRYNDLSLISRLPSELLACIFEYLRAQYTRFRLNWIRSVSHVCSRWRDVALGCPSLWSDIPFHQLEWAQEMLARSKMAALNVSITDNIPRQSYMTVPSRLFPVVVKAAVLELPHIKNLRLSQVWHLAPADYNEIIELLDAPAPFLETVEITNANLPMNLFAGVSPHLTALVLYQCNFDLRLPIFTNLRTLKLRHTPTGSKIPVDQFISALSTMTRLETLHVIDSLDHHHGVTMHSPAQQVAKLPQLAELEIDTLLSNCIFVLDHVVYPTSTRAKYQTDLNGMDDDIFIVKSFAEKLGPRVAGPIRSVELHRRSIKVWRSLHTSPSSLTASPPDLEISLPDLSNYRLSAQYFIPSLDLTHLESLIFDCYLSLELLKTYVGNLRHLTTVCAGENAITFLSALAAGLPQNKSATGADFLALETLRIEGWDFEAEAFEGEQTVFEALRSYLKRRKNAGAPLSKLFIDGCLHVDEDLYVDALRETVREVEWDGETNYTEDEDEEPSESSEECECSCHRE